MRGERLIDNDTFSLVWTMVLRKSTDGMMRFFRLVNSRVGSEMRSTARAAPETPRSLKNWILGLRVLSGLAESSCGRLEMSFEMWVLERP